MTTHNVSRDVQICIWSVYQFVHIVISCPSEVYSCILIFRSQIDVSNNIQFLGHKNSAGARCSRRWNLLAKESRLTLVWSSNEFRSSESVAGPRSGLIGRKYGLHRWRPASFFSLFSLARLFWNQTCTTRMSRPVSALSCSRTCRAGFGLSL